MYYFVTTDDLGGIVKFPLIKPDTNVGRLQENDIVLSDPEVSRQHMVIKLRNNRVWIRDLDSDNGVFVNNERINGVRWLNPSDEIIIGSNQLKLEQAPDEDEIPSITLAISKEEAKEIYESTLSLQSLPSDADIDEQTIQMGRQDIMGKLYHKKIGVLSLPRLEVFEGTSVVRRYLIPEGEFTLGRADENNIKISDPAVSSLHASIVRLGGRYQLFDKNSKNGSKVNGEFVKSIFLQHNDIIEIGGTRLQFVLPKQIKAPTEKPTPRPTSLITPTPEAIEAVPSKEITVQAKPKVPTYLWIILGVLCVILIVVLMMILFSE